MADDRNTPKNTAPPAPPVPRAPSSMEPIRVRKIATLRLDDRIPEPGRSNILQAGPRGSTTDTITIQYEPWQRHHRVREIDEHGKVKIEVCIPESWVSYVPEEWGAA
jgi:hypothetical protein